MSERRRRTVLAAVVLVGVGLRVLNAATAYVHGDEQHYAEDTRWTVAPISLATALRFLRAHVHRHHRLHPETAEVAPWSTSGPYVIGGHPTLHAYVTGVAQAVVQPTSPRGATLTARGVNLAADAATIALLPSLVAALGGGAVTGLAAAGLYAVFPPAVVYGSLANLDPFLAPLLVVLLLLVLRTSGGARRWVAIGAVTGLLACTKQPGLLALVLVPLLAWREGRGLAVWAATAALVVVALVDPADYVRGLRAPAVTYNELRFRPIQFLAGNLAVLARPSTWYWFGFAYHGRPLALPFAHVHQLVTPVYLLGYALAVGVLVLRRRWRALLALLAPTVLLLAFIEPSNGVSRFHLAAPLVCAAIALAGSVVSRRARVVLGVGALLVPLAVLLPARLGAGGAVDLGDVLFWNPQAFQRHGFYPAWRGRSVPVQITADRAVSRRLWLAPGEYEVEVTARGPVEVRVDGRIAASGAGVVVGRFPQLEVSTPRAAVVTAIDFLRPDWQE